ncbi:MAG: thiamine pyrophosphate-binding protein [Thermodesulfobacteriota bacterium]|nr:thiamine pyrophosphate-binding protein [Thermodesulfobacteriota bacterium]
MERPVIQEVVDILIEAGIDHCFGIPGGAALLLYDALFDKKDKIRSVLTRHEGAAACMADMYGRLTGRPGVVIAQGAWAASNAAFGILEAYMAGSPMLIITDVSDYSGLVQHGPWQSGSGEYGSFDLPNIMRSMTKYTTYAAGADEFAHGIQLAIKHATTGRPGPACVLARWDAFGETIDPDTSNPRLYPIDGYIGTRPPCISDKDADRIAKMLVEAKDPVMITGRGIHCARAYEEVRELAELIGMPVATSYMGKSGIAETHPLALGTMGQIGQKAANEKIQGADLLLAVGTCLAPENTKMLSPDFINPKQQKIIHMDIEGLNTGWTVPVTLGITSDAKLGLRRIIESIKRRSVDIDVNKRVETVKRLKDETGFFSCGAFSSDETPIAPERTIKEVNEAVGEDGIICLDAGNNRQWVAKHFQTKKAGQLFAPGGVGGVGWGVAAALGAQIVQPDKNVVGICGDGGMMMMLHCLETARHYNVPITYVVLNNSILGNVRDFQAPEKKISTDYPAPDLTAYARAAGCEGVKIDNPDRLKPALKKAMKSNKPTLVEVITNQEPHFKLMI